MERSWLRKSRIAAVAAILVALGPTAFAPHARAANRPAVGKRVVAAPRARTQPVAFEPNVGQADPRARFVGRADGASFALAGDEIAFRLDAGGAATVRFSGARRAAPIVGTGRASGVTNYLRGPDPAAWHRGVGAFDRVQYEQLYPGIDLVAYGNGGALEYDFVAARGADPRRIALRFSGTDGVSVDADGSLALGVGGAVIRQHAPIAYQQAEGRRRVACRYEVRPGGEVGIAVGAYDPALPLVIDPVLDIATYLGGHQQDYAQGLVLDAVGNIYIAGATASGDFPWTGPFHQPHELDYDAYVMKLDPGGTSVLSTTIIGGTGPDSAWSLALDAAGNVYVAGFTASTDFPLLHPIQQTNHDFDHFVLKLDPAGDALVYSTLLGGTGTESVPAIAVNASGEAAIFSSTLAVDYPTVHANQGHMGTPDFSDAVVAKLSADGSSLVFSTYLGGVLTEVGGSRAIAFAADGSLLVASTTDSTDFPVTPDAFQPAHGGSSDAYIARYAPDGTLAYSTFFGGTGSEAIADMRIGADGRVFVVGSTSSPNFPLVNPIQTGPDPFIDAFVTIFDPTLKHIQYSTVLGGNDRDTALALALDADGAIYVTGTTASPDFPVVDPIMTDVDGESLSGTDAFVTKISADGSSLEFSTYYGGYGSDRPTDVAVSADGELFVLGETDSFDFPTVNAIKPAWTDGYTAPLRQDGFLLAISFPGAAPVADLALEVGAPAPNPVPSGTQTSFTARVTNMGPDTARHATCTLSVGDGASFVYAEASQGSVVSAPVAGATGDVVCDLGLLPLGASATVTLVVKVDAPAGSTVHIPAALSSESVDPASGNDTGAADVVAALALSMPMITQVRAVAGAGHAFRVKIYGSDFRPSASVFVGNDLTPWPLVQQRGAANLVLRQGKTLKQRFPKGVAVQLRVVNPDGGTATTVFTR